MQKRIYEHFYPHYQLKKWKRKHAQVSLNLQGADCWGPEMTRTHHFAMRWGSYDLSEWRWKKQEDKTGGQEDKCNLLLGDYELKEKKKKWKADNKFQLAVA